MPDIKLKGVEANVANNDSRSSFANATLVRLVNVDPTNHVAITVRDAGNNIIGTFTLGNAATDFSVEAIMKAPTDTIEANTVNLARGVSIAYF